MAWDFRAALIDDLRYVDGVETVTYTIVSPLQGDVTVTIKEAVGADFSWDDVMASQGLIEYGDRLWIVSDKELPQGPNRELTDGDYLIRGNGEKWMVIHAKRDALGLAWDVIGRKAR